MATPAILFDLDGVLADTQRIHASVEAGVLKSHGITIDPADVSRRFAGVKNEEWFRQIAQEQGVELDVTAALQQKWEQYMAQIQLGIAPVPGALELLRSAKTGGWRIAVVSGSRHHAIEQVLSALGVRELVEVIVGADDVHHGKPSPEPYLRGAELLGIPPSACVVVEDGASGVIAAQAAQMKVVGLGEHATAVVPAPDLVTGSLTTITLSDLAALLPKTAV